MKYYRLLADVERYVWVAQTDQDVLHLINSEFDKVERLEQLWKPFEVEPVTERVPDPNALGDIVDLNTAAAYLFSEEARTALGSILELYGELLPVFCKGRTFYAYHVTTVLDALDEQHSIFERFRSSGRIMRIKRFAFKEEVVSNIDLFKLMDYKVLIFVSENFVKKVEANQLKGFLFEEVWGC